MTESPSDLADRCAVGWGRANLVVQAVRDHHVPGCADRECGLCAALADHDWKATAGSGLSKPRVPHD